MWTETRIMITILLFFKPAREPIKETAISQLYCPFQDSGLKKKNRLQLLHSSPPQQPKKMSLLPTAHLFIL